MKTTWNRDTYTASHTASCFSSTPYDASWDGAPEWGIDGAALQGDAQMQALLALESAIRPVSQRAQKIAHQIERLAPCGWAFPQHVEAVCRNIGVTDPAAATSAGCYVVGAPRLQLMADCALCLDGWLKRVPPAETDAAISLRAADGRNWPHVASRVWEALGEPSAPKVLLTRRLLARLRFWLRAPYGSATADGNPRLGYLYTHDMGRYGGWDYFSFEDRDPDVTDLEARIRAEMPHADRWQELIRCTWPCAPKVFRYIERLIIGIGAVIGPDAAPPELADRLNEAAILPVTGTHLDSTASRALYDGTVSALSEFVGNAFPPSATDRTSGDIDFAERLLRALGQPTPERQWLAALLLKRITLFEESFKSFHFTRNMNHAA